MDEKVCRSCSIRKPLSDFYVHSAMADGHLNKCADCVRKRVTKHRKANIEKARKYDRTRGRTKKRLEAVRQYQKKKRAEYRIIKRRWVQKNRHKKAAHAKVRKALESGALKKLPCEVCGRRKVEGHHEDYNKPLQVRWLCIAHHKERHRRYKE